MYSKIPHPLCPSSLITNAIANPGSGIPGNQARSQFFLSLPYMTGKSPNTKGTTPPRLVGAGEYTKGKKSLDFIGFSFVTPHVSLKWEATCGVTVVSPAPPFAGFVVENAFFR